MSRGKLYVMVGSLGAMAVVAAVALTLVFSQGGSGPAGSSPEPVAFAVGLAQASGGTVTSVGGPAAALSQGGPVSESGLEAAVKPSEPSGGGASEGIKVHGAWTIEVREPDGTLVSRTEFQNAITGQGSANWTNHLGRSSTPGKWRVGVTSTSSPCGGTTRCIIGESTDSGTETTLFKTLTVNSPATGVPSPSKLVLSGNFTAQATGSVSTVSSAAGNCVPTIAPASCTVVGSLDNPDTSTTLASPVSVTLGQQVLITVNITFS